MIGDTQTQSFAVGNRANNLSSQSVVNLQKLFKNKKTLGTFLFFAISAIFLVTGLRFVSSQGVVRGVMSSPTNSQSVRIEKEFNFRAFDKNKKLGESVRYTIAEAQLTKQIVVKGQKANAVNGRMFLILNLKLVNETSQPLFLNTRNFIRIQPAGSNDKLAPEIHNDTVEIQALSTKLTRLALPVNEHIKEFILFAGEIDGKKEEIKINF